MTDFLSKYRLPASTSPQVEKADILLNALCEQLYFEWKAKGIRIIPYVTTSQGLGMAATGTVTIHLKLMTDTPQKQYFYDLIEVEQPIDRHYPVTISAFQNPPTAPKTINTPTELRNELIEIMGDKRIKVVVEMVNQMGKTIQSWTLKSKLGDDIANKDLLSDDI